MLVKCKILAAEIFDIILDNENNIRVSEITKLFKDILQMNLDLSEFDITSQITKKNGTCLTRKYGSENSRKCSPNATYFRRWTEPSSTQCSFCSKLAATAMKHSPTTVCRCLVVSMDNEVRYFRTSVTLLSFLRVTCLTFRGGHRRLGAGCYHWLATIF
jgi:hypothetical protein